MDGLRWSRVLLQWVKDSRLVPDAADCDSIERCSVQEFYVHFRSRMEPTIALPQATVIEFLREHFPHYELYLTESGQIAAPDHFYIFSLLLYFSCVRQPERFFQQICNGFDKPQQYAVTAFLKAMLEGSAHLRQEIDRTMIRKAIEDALPNVMMPPTSPVAGGMQIKQEQQLQQSNSQQSFPSASRLTIGSSDVTDSPLRLNTRALRMSPPTPKTLILDERTRQLKELKAQLEAERYEKGYLEVQLKQLQDKNDKFLEDKRKLLKDIRELKTELQSCNRENESPNKRRGGGGEDHKMARIERQLLDREEALDKLRIELETVSENNKNATEMINYRNNQIVVLKDKILELEGSIVTLSECLEKKEEMIKYLRENCEDLQNFIEENRLKNECLNTSVDMLDLSSAGSGSTGASGSIISPENMANAVVDVQLKEKEAENALLKRSLELIEQEKVRVSGLVGQFFRLYGDMVGKFPLGVGNPEEVGFVEKMQMFKVCYETLFEEYGKCREGRELFEEKNETLEKEVEQLRAKVCSVSDVLRKLESHSAELEKELAAVKRSADEAQMRQKRDFLKLIAEKDALTEKFDASCAENLTLKVELNSVRSEYETIASKIDYLMVTLDEDYESSDFASWLEKMEDLRSRLDSLKQDKEQLTSMNMRLTMEKVALEKEIANGEDTRSLLKEQNLKVEQSNAELNEQLRQVREALAERDEAMTGLEKVRADLEENIQSLSQELLEAQDKLKVSVEELESRGTSFKELADQLQAKENDLVVFKTANSELQSDVETEKVRIQQLKELLQQNTDENEELARHIEDLQLEVSNKSLELQENTTKFDELYQEHLTTKNERDQLAETKTLLEGKLQEQQQQLINSSQNIATLEANVRNLEELLAKQAQQADDQQNSARIEQELMASCNQTLLAGMNVLQDKIGHLEANYKLKNAGLSEKIDQINELLKRLCAYQYKLRFEKGVLEDNLAKMKEEMEVLRERNARHEEAEKELQDTVDGLKDENVAFEEELIGLKDRLKAEEEKVGGLRSQIESLTAETGKSETQLKEQLHTALKSVEKLQSEVATLEQVRSTLDTQLKEETSQLRSLSDELEVKCTRLEVELKETQISLEGQEQICSKTSQANVKLEQQLDALGNDLSQVESERVRLEKDLFDCQTELSEQHETTARLRNDKEILETKIQELASALSVTRQSRSTLQETLEQEQEKSEELSCQLAGLNEKLGIVAEEVARLTEEQEALLGKQEELLREREELTERVAELTESVAVLEEDRDTLREEKCRLEAECDRVDFDKEELQKQCGNLLNELAKQREEAAGEKKRLEEEVRVIAEERGVLEEKLREIGEEQDSLKRKVQELEDGKKTLEVALSEKGDVENRVSELVKAMDELRSEKTTLESEKAHLMKDLEAHQSTIEKLQGEQKVLSEARKQLEEELKTIRDGSEELQKQLKLVTEEYDDSKEKRSALETDVINLTEQLATAEAEVLNKNTAFEEIRSDLLRVEESLKSKVDELNAVSEHLLEKTKELEAMQQEKEKEILVQTESIQCVRQEQERTQQERNEVQTKLESLSVELESRTEELRAAIIRLEAKELEIRSTVESLTAEEARSAEFSQRLGEASQNNTELEARMAKLLDEIDVQKEALLAKQREIEHLSEKLSEAAESKNVLQRKLQEVDAVRVTLESQVQQLNQQSLRQTEENVALKDAIEVKDTEVCQLTEGLEKVKMIQQNLEEKVSDFETVVSEKDEVEMQLMKLQNALDVFKEDKQKLAEKLEKLNEEKSDVDRRLIQQLQDYDTLNEVFMSEREQKQELEKKQQELVQQLQGMIDENDRLMAGQENMKTQLSSKEKRLAEQEKQMEKLKREMEALFGKNQQLDSLSHQFMTLKVEKTQLEAKKEELNEIIETKEIQEKALQEGMEHLRESLKAKQQDLDTIHSEVTSLKESLHNMKIENSKLKSEQELQQTKMLNQQLKIDEQSKKIEQLEASLSKTEESHLEDNTKATTLLKELEKHKLSEQRLKQLEELHLREREINAKCLQDNEILSAKLKRNRKQTEEKEQQWTVEKQRLLEKLNDSSKSAEEKVKETRIEYEGKLEKMKEKMKTLYNDEMEKVRTKHEKDFLSLKADLQQEIKKFDKLTLHSTKLQQQMSTLNEKNLELMKENEFMRSKIRIMEEIRTERKSMLPPPPAHTRMCSNLKMEDEEGEIFNNTYLTDLKAGRMSPPFAGRDSIRYSELQQRNSMLPPHLKSSYLPQYTDGDLTDDDNRDQLLDNSSTSLISHKKQGGTTSYKRPGPPTPSKKAGRLSFGGSIPTNDFQYKEILKDTTGNNCSSSSNGAGGGGIGATLKNRLSFGGRKSNIDPSTLPAAGSSSGTGSFADMNDRRKTPGKFKQMLSSTTFLNQLHKDKDETPRRAPLQHPAIHKITCDDETDSTGSSGGCLEDRKASRRAKRRDSIGLRASSKAHKVPHVRKLIGRFDKNRRLSSVDSDSPGSSPRSSIGPASSDPYSGFSITDRIQKIDINAMEVFARDRKVVVFTQNASKAPEQPGGKKQQEQLDLNNNAGFPQSDFVQRLCTTRRDKLRRKSRDQRRESFNRWRNIDCDAIAYRSEEIVSCEAEEEPSPVNSSMQEQFESLLEEIWLDRPSEILPSARTRGRYLANDPMDNVVTSSTGLRPVSGIPLLERFSEIFRIAGLQRNKMERVVSGGDGGGERTEGLVGRSGQSGSDRTYSMLVMFAGLSFSALVFSLYLHYVGFRVPRDS